MTAQACVILLGLNAATSFSHCSNELILSHSSIIQPKLNFEIAVAAHFVYPTKQVSKLHSSFQHTVQHVPVSPQLHKHE